MTSYQVVHGCDVPIWAFYPNVDQLYCSPTSLCCRASFLCLSSLKPYLYPPPRVCFTLNPCVCCVCVLRVQIPTGPLIFNSLQQPQLSQFSPQQSQSATSSPQQQGETVRHTSTLTHVERQSWSYFKQLSFNTEWDIVNCWRQTLNA